MSGRSHSYGLSTFLKERPKHYFPAALAALAVLAVAVLFIALPEVHNLLIASLISLLRRAASYHNCSGGAGLVVGGSLGDVPLGSCACGGRGSHLIWWSRKKANPGHVFVLIWTAIILASIGRARPLEYYLAANIALLAAVFASAVINATWKDVARLLHQGAAMLPSDSEKRQKEVKKKKKGGKTRDAGKPKASRKDRVRPLKVGAFVAVVVVTLVFSGISLGATYDMAKAAKYGGIDSQWMEALEWMGANTPDPGVDYYAIYDRETFTYPGGVLRLVMSWWDYGHWITFVSKRIPNNNPFQHGVAGPNGSAVYLTSTSRRRQTRSSTTSAPAMS